MAKLSDYGKQVEEVLSAARQLVDSGIMTRSLHGNISVKVPDADMFLLTSGGSLGALMAADIALFDADGNLLDGTVQPVGAEIIQMHGIVYRKRPAFSGVVHTHSPFATGFAVAGQAIPAAYEALIRFGMNEGVPLARYGPRGSQQSVDNIGDVLTGFDQIKALLLENHGVLAFGDSVASAVRSNMVVEESAEIVLYSHGLGGPKPIPPEMIEATQARAASFAQAGTYSSETRST
jgi:L-fuculose-phosphate aldolase